MKKKILYILILLISIIPLGGCFEEEKINSTKITTTIYPFEYIINRLYTKENVTSIYPNGTDISNYKLTNKQIDEFSKNTNLFIIDEKSTYELVKELYPESLTDIEIMNHKISSSPLRWF